MFKKALTALTLIISLPATACSVLTPEFHDLLEQPTHAIVVGHYLPEPSDTSGRHYSNLFIVTEVLKGNGDIKLQQYQLMMTGPWGNTCEVSTQKASGSPEEKNNPVVLLIDRKIDKNTLDLPFMGPKAGIVDGDVITTRSYIKKSQKPYDWQSLNKPQEIKMKLATFKQWLRSDRSQPVPWQVTHKQSN
jgi:hypothetical protein